MIQLDLGTSNTPSVLARAKLNGATIEIVTLTEIGTTGVYQGELTTITAGGYTFEFEADSVVLA